MKHSFAIGMFIFLIGQDYVYAQINMNISCRGQKTQTYINQIEMYKELIQVTSEPASIENYQERRLKTHEAMFSELAHIAAYQLDKGNSECVNGILKAYRFNVAVSVNRLQTRPGFGMNTISIGTPGADDQPQHNVRQAYKMLFGGLSFLGHVLMPDSLLEKSIIDASIKEYQQPCPCPYSFDSIGLICGDRSAWSINGGKSPLCYANQIYLAQKFDFRNWYANTQNVYLKSEETKN